MTRLSIDEMLLKAAQVAARAHQGQKRKDGTPYIAHPVRVAIRCGAKIYKVVALLHDVIEDTDVTVEELRELGFTEEVILAVDAVTKRPGEQYADFIKRIKAAGELAIAVKLADIEDNLEDQSALDEDEAKFLKNRYTKAREILES